MHTLDYLVEQQQKKQGQYVDHAKINENCDKLDEIDKKIHQVEKSMQSGDEGTKARGKILIENMRRQKCTLLSETNALRQMKKTTAKNANFIESEILHKSKIILTTLSMSGIEMLDKLEFTFSHLIIDEACQSTEVSTLIPFMHDIKKVIFVGDQNQLPATVFSNNSETTKFNRSLFERFLDNKIPKFVLNIQYRMHPTIRAFPSNQFYNGEIVDAPSIAKRAIHDMGAPHLMFYNLTYTKSTNEGKSKVNDLEADFIAKLFLEAVTMKGEGEFYKGLETCKGEIGIITPYKKQ